MMLRFSNTGAFSLAEVTVALSVAAFTLVAIFGLLPVGLDSARAAIGQTAANGIISAVISDLRATQPDANSSDQFGIAIPTDPAAAFRTGTILYFNAEGKAATNPQSDSRYRLEIKFLLADHTQAPAHALLQMTWPAAAKPEDAQGTVKVFCAINRH